MTLHKSIEASRKIVPVCCCIKVAEEYSWHSDFEKNISVKLHDLGHGEKKKLLRLDNFFSHLLNFVVHRESIRETQEMEQVFRLS